LGYNKNSVCLPTYLPTQKKAIELNVFIEILKKKFFFNVFTKMQIPKPKFSSGFSHRVCISAAMSEDKDIKQLSQYNLPL